MYLSRQTKVPVTSVRFNVFRATPAHWIMSNIATGLSQTISLGGEEYGIEIVVEGYPGTVCGNADEI